MKRRSKSSSLQAFVSLLVICCLGILPALGSPASQSISSYGTIVYSSANQVPPDGYCYHSGLVYVASGLPSDAEALIKAFTAMVGKDLFYDDASGVDWNENLWFTEGPTDWKPLMDKGLIQALSCIWDPTLRNVFTDDYTVQQIANGQYDDYVRMIADECKREQHPIFMRLGHEMNINQGNGTWAGAYSFGKNPATFVAAWRRIVDLFRAEGASNAVFVWNPNCEDIGPHHWTEYYPGDDYVDWVSTDIYQFQPNSDPGSLMAGIYNDYYARKPMMITEWGANWEGQNFSDVDRAAFINRFFDAVEARPQIKSICYWFVKLGIIDYTFDPSTLPLTTAAYANRISNQRYITHPP